MNEYFRHINHTAEDFAAWKYEAQDLSSPIRSITALSVTPFEFPGVVMKNDKEGYAIIMGANGMTIRFLKSKATGEAESITVPYPKNGS